MGSRGRRPSPALAALLVLGLLSGCTTDGTSRASDDPARLSGTVVDDPPVPLPAARLVSTDGRAVDLRAVSPAALTLTVFAYTTCPDQCPLTVSSITAALRGLPARERDAVQLVVLSADPVRDTPAVLRRWLDRFDSDFVGLTGEPETLSRVARELYVPLVLPSQAAPLESAGPAGTDDPQHGVQIWAFGRDDQSRMVWSGSPSVEALRTDLSRLIRQELAAARP